MNHVYQHGRWLPLWLALVCSLLTGAAQLGAKWATTIFLQRGWLDSAVLGLLALSYGLLGLGFVAFLLALRNGALSTVYPVLAARYVWVVALTPLFFSGESLNVYKLAGTALAAAGVALVARAGVR